MNRFPGKSLYLAVLQVYRPSLLSLFKVVIPVMTGDAKQLVDSFQTELYDPLSVPADPYCRRQPTRVSFRNSGLR